MSMFSSQPEKDNDFIIPKRKKKKNEKKGSPKSPKTLKTQKKSKKGTSKKGGRKNLRTPSSPFDEKIGKKKRSSSFKQSERRVKKRRYSFRVNNKKGRETKSFSLMHVDSRKKDLPLKKLGMKEVEIVEQEKLLSEELMVKGYLSSIVESKSLIITGFNFEVIPKDFFEILFDDDHYDGRVVKDSIMVIKFSYNKLKEFPAEITEFPELITICLDHNRIDVERFPREIEFFFKLRFLDLSHNLLRKIPREIFKLIKLKFLNLSYNRLEEIHPLISKLKKLKHLEFASNKISVIPTEIGELKLLKILSFNDNSISAIPKDILMLKNLRNVFFARNQIKSENICEDFFSTLKNIRVLDLRRNLLTKFPTFAGFHDLEGIYLNSNEISMFPFKEFSISPENKLITIVDLSKNEITEFPASLVNICENLMQLDLSFNRICSLPDDMKEFKLLKRLLLVQNCVTELNEHFILNNLVELKMSFNKIRKINEKVFENLGKLQILFMDHNELERIPNSVFHLKDVVLMNISYNKLKVIPDSFVKLEKLEFLDFSYNKINLLPYEFQKLSLRKLKLSYNDIEDPPHEISKITTLTFADLRGNPFLKTFQNENERRKKHDLEMGKFLNDDEYEKKLKEHLLGRDLNDILELPNSENVVCKLQ